MTGEIMKTIINNGKEVQLITDSCGNQNGVVKVYDSNNVSVIKENQELFLLINQLYNCDCDDITREIVSLSDCSLINDTDIAEEIYNLIHN